MPTEARLIFILETTRDRNRQRRFDPVKTMKKAAARYLTTKAGKEILNDTNGEFDYEIFSEEIPEEITQKYDFIIKNVFISDQTVNHDESLIPTKK